MQSAAMLVRRDAAERVGYLDPDFFVYSDETDFCKRLHDAGWRILYVPAAARVHHEQLATDRGAGERRVVEFHRGRDLYMRKHHGAAVAAVGAAAHGLAVRGPARSSPLVLPGHRPGVYWLHARQALRPERGEGLREAGGRLQPLRGPTAQLTPAARRTRADPRRALTASKTSAERPAAVSSSAPAGRGWPASACEPLAYRAPG